MKKTFKCIISLFLCLIILCGNINLLCFDLTVNAGDAIYTTSGIYVYYTADDGLWLESITDKSIEEISIPSTIDGKPLVYIDYDAFKECTALKKIQLPSSITGADGRAFSDTAYYKDSSNWQNGILYINDVLIEASKSLSGNVTIKDGTRVLADFAFSGCSAITSLSMPSTLRIIGGQTFEDCTGLTKISFPERLETIGWFSFSDCSNLKSITLGNNLKQLSSTSFSGTAFEKNSANWQNGILYIGKYLVDTEDDLGDSIVIKSGTVLVADHAFSYSSIKKITIPTSVLYINYEAFAGCESLADVYYKGTKEQRNTINIVNSEGSGYYRGNNPLLNAKWHYDPGYNLGDETYSFENYVDSDSKGHCFGMSMTSAGYYNNLLKKSTIGLKDNSLYSVKFSDTVKKPICYYQDIQGPYSLNATVAGGSWYKTGKADIASDWKQVINYVKNHNYDNKGTLQIGFRKTSEGGHAINFLRYEEVNGQQRIYAYDNNYPNIETYFYKSSDGKIFQAPKSTFSGAIDCIALRDVETYFSMVSTFDKSGYIYAAKDNISVSGATVYAIETDVSRDEYVMFELPDDAKEVKIVPLKDNAEFEYMDTEYNFEKINENTSATLVLSTSTETNNATFSVENGGSGNWFVDFLATILSIFATIPFIIPMLIGFLTGNL